MEQNLVKYKFDMTIKKSEIIFLCIYFPIHIIGIPLLFSYFEVAGILQSVDELTLNFGYYGFGVIMCLIFAKGIYRRSFDALCDRFFKCVFSALIGYILIMLANYAVAMVEMNLSEVTENINETNVESLATLNYGMFAAMAMYLAPIVEEGLFRGLFFTVIRPKSRVLAYIVSAGLFSLYHVWQFAVLYQDPTYLLVALEYLPAALILCWSYDRTGSIWTPIMVHMMVNGVGVYAMNMM